MIEAVSTVAVVVPSPSIVTGLRGDLAHHLSAHVLEFVFKFDLLGDGDAGASICNRNRIMTGVRFLFRPPIDFQIDFVKMPGRIRFRYETAIPRSASRSSRSSTSRKFRVSDSRRSRFSSSFWLPATTEIASSEPT